MAKHLHVEFFEQPVENPAKSREAGRPIYDEREMVRIRYAGDTKNVHVAPAHEKFKLGENGAHVSYAEEFPDHYKVFKDDKQVLEAGTPVDELPFISKSKAAELKAINIRTAEALATLNSSGIKRLGMGGRDLVDQAAQYLEQAKDGALLNRMSEEKAAMQAQIDELKAMIQAAPPATEAAPSGDGPEGWSDDQLRAFLTEQGAEPRSNANREKMVSAAKEFMAVEVAA